MKFITSIFCLVLMISGCATKTKKEIAAEKSMVKSIHSRQDLVEKTRMILEKSPHLSKEQRDQFLNLHTDIISKVDESTQEIRKLKILLFKEMTNQNFNKVKVDIITKQIKKAYNERLDVMLNAMKEAQGILGVQAKEIFKEKWFQEHYRI